MTIETGSIITQTIERLKNFSPQSNVRFHFEPRSGGMIIPVRRSGKYTDQEVLNYIRNVHKQDSYFDSLNPIQQAEFIAEARDILETEKLGGLGITHRSLSQIEEILPGVTERLSEARGNIVILGNGLSTAPEEIMALHDKHEIKPSITLLDLVDPQELLTDIIELKETFIKNKIPFPETYEQDLDRCALLVALIQTEKVKFVHYFLGDSSPPKEAQEADFILNIHGPNEASQEEQISLLNKGGIFITNYRFTQTEDPSVIIEPYFLNHERKGTLVRKV